MNPTFSKAYAAELATMVRVVDAPTGALGYGTDLSCTTDVDERLTEVDPQTPRAIAESIIRRFITPRGALIDDGDYGLDVRGHLNRGITQQDLRALSGALQSEAQKDDRVLAAHVELRVDTSAGEMFVNVTIAPADPNAEPFTFVFSVTSGAVLGVTIHG
jgi:hypothetical protein